MLAAAAWRANYNIPYLPCSRPRHSDTGPHHPQLHVHMATTTASTLKLLALAALAPASTLATNAAGEAFLAEKAAVEPRAVESVRVPA